MIYKNLSLNTAEGYEKANLSLYLHENSKEIEVDRKRPIFIILPGGAYHFLSDREKEPVALALMAKGYNACVLNYSVAPVRFPNQLLQVLTTIKYLRQNADEYFVDENKIIVMGFSAGGHLAASSGVFWAKPHYAKILGAENNELKLNALVLSYPVISAYEYAHEYSIDCLTGDDKELYRSTVSLDKQVDHNTPPSFIWHTSEDKDVPCENSIMFVSALRKFGTEVEFHLFSKGEHGLSLSNAEVYSKNNPSIVERCASWFELMDSWVKQLWR